jgi:hypothetical protein
VGRAQARRLLAASGARRYLLESPDFWAMRELVDLSQVPGALYPETLYPADSPDEALTPISPALAAG